MTDDLEKRLADAEAEIARLRQGLWDAWVALGHDSDGDTGPGAWIAGSGVDSFIASVVRDAATFRQESEEDYDADTSRLEDALRTLRERVAGLADEWEVDYPLSGPPFYVTDLRAVLAYAPAEEAPALPTPETSGAGSIEATPPAECGAKHPTNSSVVPCVRDEGHEGSHMSTTGCAGSVMHWAATPPAEQRAEP